jgi:hypothetical protein
MIPDREFDLAVALCLLAWSGCGAERCLELAGQADPRRLAAIAARHRIEAIVADGLRRIGHPIPPALADAPSDSARDHLRAIANCARLNIGLAAQGIDHLFVKGASLAAMAWPNPALKMSADIDLLVAPGDVEPAADLIERLGFRPFEPSRRSSLSRWHRRRKESLWVRGDGMQVDLHTALTDHPALLAGPIMGAPRQQVTVTDGVSLPTLNDELLYAYLCVHGAWSSWFRLKWLADLAAFLARRSRPIAHLHAAAASRGAGRASAQALLLIDRLFGLDDPDQHLNRLASDPSHIRLRDRALVELLEPLEPLDRRFGTLRLRLAQLQLLPGTAPRLREAARQIWDVLDRRLT